MGGLGPRHVVHLGTVLNHVDGLHMNKIAARPPTHQDGPEMHPDMVVEGTMVGGIVVTEWAEGYVDFYLGRNAVHHMCFFGRYPCHGGRMDNIVQSHVLLPSILAGGYSPWADQSNPAAPRTTSLGKDFSTVAIPCTFGKEVFRMD